MTIEKKQYMTPTETHELKKKIETLENAIRNYEELDSDIESPEYVARGNGFCDSKYSEDFIEGQLERLHRERKQLEGLLSTL